MFKKKVFTIVMLVNFSPFTKIIKSILLHGLYPNILYKDHIFLSNFIKPLNV